MKGRKYYEETTTQNITVVMKEIEEEKGKISNNTVVALR